MASTEATTRLPRRSPSSVAATVRNLQRYVLPLMAHGVPLAFAAAGPSLRLCTEGYRADETLTRDFRSGELQPLLLDGVEGTEENGFGLYEAYLSRHCGVRVGALIMLLHDTGEEAQSRRETQLVAELVRGKCGDGEQGSSSSNNSNSRGHGKRWAPSSGCLPPLPFLESSDLIAVHDAAVADSFPAFTPTVVSGLGAACESGLAVLLRDTAYARSLAGAPLEEVHRLRSQILTPVSSIVYSPIDRTDGFDRRLVRIKHDAGMALVWRQQQQQQQPPPPRVGRAHEDPHTDGKGGRRWKRSLFFWTEGVAFPETVLSPCYQSDAVRREGGGGDDEAIQATVDREIDRALSRSLWWLLRQATPTPVDHRESPQCAKALSLPTHLHVYSTNERRVRVTCRALCGVGSTTASASRDAELRLEGLHVVSHPAEAVVLPGPSNDGASLLTQPVQSHLRILRILSCVCTTASLRAALRPVPLAAEEPLARPSPRGLSSQPVTWMPRLEAVDLSGHEALQGPPFLFDEGAPEEGTRRPAVTPDAVTPLLCPTLTTLNLSRTDLRNECLALVAVTCGRLAALDVSACRHLTDLNVLAWSEAQQRPTGLADTLWYLDASSTKVTNSGIARLSELTRLASVSLSNCTHLSDVGPLAKLPLLREVNLISSWIKAGLEKLYANERLEQIVLMSEVRVRQYRAVPTGGLTVGLFRELLLANPPRASASASASVPVDAPLGKSPFSGVAFRALTRLVLSDLPWFDDDCMAVLARCGAPIEHLVLDGLHSLNSLDPIADAQGGSVMQYTLVSLVLSGLHGVTTDSARSLATCQALQHAAVEYCYFFDDLGSVFSHVCSLRSLRILSTRIVDNGNGGTLHPHLRGYASPHGGRRALEILSFSEQDGLENVDFLSGMPRLKVIDLQSTGVTSESLAHGVEGHLSAAAMPGVPLPASPSLLHTIDLTYCSKVVDVSCLARLPSLRSVYLARTGVTDEGIEALLFSPTSFVEYLNLTECGGIAMAFDVPSLVRRYWGGGTRRWPVASSLKSLSLMNHRSLTDAALTRLFAPFHKAVLSKGGYEEAAEEHGAAETYFTCLSRLDLANCRALKSIRPLLPLASSLRRLTLRRSTVNTEGLSRLHQLYRLESLDISDTDRIGSLVAVLTHPRLKALNICSLSLYEEEEEEEEDGGGGGFGLLAEEEDAFLFPALAPKPRGGGGGPPLPPYLPTPEQLTASPLEVLSFAFEHAETVERVVAPLLLSMTAVDERGGAPQEGKVSDESTPRWYRPLKVLPALHTLQYRGTLKTRRPKGRTQDGGKAGEMDRGELLCRIKLAHPLLIVRRI